MNCLKIYESTNQGDFPTLQDLGEIRSFEPIYKSNQFVQSMTYIANENKAPIEKLSEIIYKEDLFHTKSDSFKVVNLELKCPDQRIIVGKDKIKFSSQVMFDYDSLTQTLRASNIKFEAMRTLLKDGSSQLNGYKCYDFDEKQLTVKDKVEVTELKVEVSTLSSIIITGDFCKVYFEDKIFNDLEISIKSRGLNDIMLGKSNVKTINIDAQTSSVHSGGIEKCN